MQSSYNLIKMFRFIFNSVSDQPEKCNLRVSAMFRESQVKEHLAIVELTKRINSPMERDRKAGQEKAEQMAKATQHRKSFCTEAIAQVNS